MHGERRKIVVHGRKREGFEGVRGMGKVLWQHGEEEDEGDIWFGGSGD